LRYLRAADPHQLIQSCCSLSNTEFRKLHHTEDGEPIERVADAAKTFLQAGLRLFFSFFRQAMILSTFGISELHNRKTSGVHAARSSAVPKAMLAVG
jgi:hypothetical protein